MTFKGGILGSARKFHLDYSYLNGTTVPFDSCFTGLAEVQHLLLATPTLISGMFDTVCKAHMEPL